MHIKEKTLVLVMPNFPSGKACIMFYIVNDIELNLGQQTSNVKRTYGRSHCQSWNQLALILKVRSQENSDGT
jgi:hypothetical protein